MSNINCTIDQAVAIKAAVLAKKEADKDLERNAELLEAVKILTAMELESIRDGYVDIPASIVLLAQKFMEENTVYDSSIVEENQKFADAVAAQPVEEEVVVNP